MHGSLSRGETSAEWSSSGELADKFCGRFCKSCNKYHNPLQPTTASYITERPDMQTLAVARPAAPPDMSFTDDDKD